ncbi:MAG: hypothetical protein RR333_08320 [Bacteroidales bacterium]
MEKQRYREDYDRLRDMTRSACLPVLHNDMEYSIAVGQIGRLYSDLEKMKVSSSQIIVDLARCKTSKQVNDKLICYFKKYSNLLRFDDKFERLQSSVLSWTVDNIIDYDAMTFGYHVAPLLI